MTRRELEVTDMNEILEILDKCKVLHLALVDDGMPYVLAMNYGYTMEDGKLPLYLHGAAKGYKVDVIRKNPVCAFEMECDVIPFPGEMACQYGTSYSSLMGRGKAVIIEDPKEKTEAMRLFMGSQTGKDFEFTEKLVSIVSLIRIDVDIYTAKKRPIPRGSLELMKEE